MASTQSDNINLSNQVYGSINRAVQDGFITDAMVAASPTKALLKQNINATRVAADQENLKILFTRALDYDAGITDAALSGISTAAGLLALVNPVAQTNLDILE